MASTDPDRRGILNLLTSLLLLVIAVLLVVPALLYLRGSLRRKEGAGDGAAEFVDAGPLADLPIGPWRLVSVEVVHEEAGRKTRLRHALYVRRQGAGDGDITVLSSICPHLGCPLNWHRDQSQFVCPCHNGTFDAEGRPTGGPPPRPMDPLPFFFHDGHLFVRWQDFKSGAPQSIPTSA
jgi:Rieske Fe-S protein